MEGGRSLSDLSEGEKDSIRFELNVAGFMPNVTGSETNIIESKQIYAKHHRILENLS